MQVERICPRLQGNFTAALELFKKAEADYVAARICVENPFATGNDGG